MFSFSSRVLSSWLVKSVSWVRRIQSVSYRQTAQLEWSMMLERSLELVVSCWWCWCWCDHCSSSNTEVLHVTEHTAFAARMNERDSKRECGVGLGLLRHCSCCYDDTLHTLTLPVHINRRQQSSAPEYAENRRETVWRTRSSGDENENERMRGGQGRDAAAAPNGGAIKCVS